MGRKRRNAGAALKGDDNEASAAKLSDDAWGLLVTLLDLAGLFPRASDCFDGSHRQQLVRSIQQLAAELMRHNIDSKWNDHSVPLNAESSAHLRRIEDGIGQLRRDAESFLSNLATERMEVVETSHNFDECIGALQRSLVCWRAFAQSLLESYRAQSALEEGEVRNVLPLILDDVYTSTRGSPDAAFRLQGLAECLSRDAFLEKYNYREEVQMIRRVALQGHDPASIGKAATIESTTAPAKPMVRSPLSQIHADPNVVQAKTALSAVATFLRPRSSMDAQGTFTCILVVGSEGSGKTHLCNMAETMASASMPSTHTIRPHLPLDILQSTVGETEDVLISLGGAIRRCDGNVLVIVDEAEHIFGAETPQEHRCRSTALSLLDSLRTSFAPARQVLFVFTTSNSRIGAELSRFDQTYHLGLPDEHERRSLVTDLLQNVGGTQYSKGEQHDSLLASIVDSTVGRSYSELVQYYRQAIETTVSTDGRMEPGRYRASLLVALKHRLQAITPESLRAGVCDDYVEMRVLAAHDLCAIASTGDESNSAFPMKGKSAALAWKALQTSIIIPLCRSKELHALLGEDDLGNRRSVLGAILLAGEPGSGKSEIAMHCAKHAAQLLPTMKLIDVSCTSLIHKEVGRSERAVHHLFDAARKAAPCIILMDGIENIAAVRGNDSTSEGTMDRVLSTLLVEMDGLDDGQKTQNGGIAVIGVTHDAAWIDPALKRPGRLDRAVRLDRDWM